jgi:hypothetical protein
MKFLLLNQRTEVSMFQEFLIVSNEEKIGEQSYSFLIDIVKSGHLRIDTLST